MRRNRLLAAGLAVLSLAACRDDAKRGTAAASSDADAAGGTLVISSAADPEALLPPLAAGGPAKQATELLFDHLAEIGDSLNTVGDRGFTPRLAQRWEWTPDSLGIVFHLDPRARWHDGRPVTARDVRFTQQLYADPATGSPFTTLIATIDSVQARDSLTPVFWFKRRSPEQFFTAVYQMVVMPEHLLGTTPHDKLRTSPFATRPVGSGRFRFARYVPGQLLEFVADTANYRGRAKLDRVIWSISPDFSSAATRLLAGDADFFETLRPEQVAELAKHKELAAAPYPSLTFAYLDFNLKRGGAPAAHPVFGDVSTRRALSMAVDRAAIVKNVYDTLAYVGVGPGVRAQGPIVASLRQIPFDTAAAARSLDSLGWRDANGDGVRERAGRPLAFSILVPTSSQTRVRAAVLLQEQFRKVGAKVDVEQLEFPAVMARMAKHDFDATIVVFSTDPNLSGAKQAWTAEGIGGDGSNSGSYVDPAVDAALDSAGRASGAADADRYFARAYQRIVDDAPAVWLYEPRLVAGVARRVRTTGMRADAWWARLADWTIPPSERTPRDRVGLAPAASAQ